MELEFEREQLYDYETVLDTTLCQEETMEAIVPDACPDIGRVIDCCGQVFLTGKQAQEQQAGVNGMIRAVVLYQPEEGTGLRKLQLTLPFTCKAECPAMIGEEKVAAKPELRQIQARALNPRKVLLRVDLAMDITVCRARERRLCTGAAQAEELGLCQLYADQDSYELSAVQERPFTFTETVRLPGGEGQQLLACRGSAVCSESKLIGSKLIFKGMVNLQLLMQDGNGQLSSQQQTMAFSQVMEAAGAGESSVCHMDVELTDLSWQSPDEDGRELEFKAELLAQAMVWAKRPVRLLRDLYSTRCLTYVTTQELVLPQLLDHSVRTQSVREMVETEWPVRSVVDCWLMPGEVDRRQEGDWVTAVAPFRVNVLYLDDQGQLQSVQHEGEASCRLECPQGAQCRIQCGWNGELFASLAAAGIEVRFSLDLHCMVLRPSVVQVVCGAQLGEERTRGEDGQPSVVLRMAGPEERLWDIAKAYGTTREEICRANGLEEEEIPAQTMLLIPRVR